MKEYQLQPFLIKNNSAHLFLNSKVVGYIILFAFLSIPVGFLATINYRSEIFAFVIRLIQVNNFIFLGMLHSELLATKPIFAPYSLREKLYFSFVLSLVIYFALLLFYFVLNRRMEMMAIASSCAFLLPFMIVQAWNHYYQLIPVSKPMIWNGYKRVDVKTDVAYLNSILIRFRLSKRFEDEEISSYLVNIPLNLELGKLFNSFLNIENKDGRMEIECIGQNDKIYGWKFYVVSFGGIYKRTLDPGMNLQNNGNIRKNTTILAKRVEIL